MNIIHILPELLINKIAAGEVVDRPASVVKELVENSIDAGANQILVTVKNGGKESISVLDNGKGMSEKDAKLSVERHATSKIQELEDLYRIDSMGFRGEALAAISSVSNFELTTCADEKVGGFRIAIDGGHLDFRGKVGFPRGTRIVVNNLFFNTPARQKFMKASATEEGHIHQVMMNLALGYPQIQFRLTHNQKVVLNFPKDQSFAARIKSCFGEAIFSNLIEFDHKESYLSFHGLFSRPSAGRPSKRWQHLFVNDRYVKCKSVNHAIYEGYKTLLMKNMHPLFFLKLRVEPSEVDVNVHPAKTEVRLKNPNLIHTILSDKISKYLKQGSRKIFFDEQVLSPNKYSADEFPAKMAEPITTPTPSEAGTSSGTPATTIPVPAPMHKIEASGQLVFDSISQEQTKKKNPHSQPVKEKNRLTKQNETVDNPFSFRDATNDPREHKNQTVAVKSSRYQVIGQLQATYILAQYDNVLVLVDQHAAHERIRFEEYRTQFYSKNISSERLAIPIILPLAPHDGLLLEQYQEYWGKMGFVIDHFGGNDYSIKEIPSLLVDKDVTQVIRDVLDEIASFGKSGKLEKVFNEVFEKVACHSSIRAGMELSELEMQRLLDQLESLDMNLYCPHGRPILVELTMDELGRKFKRIV